MKRLVLIYACTFNCTPMVDVTGCPSSFICICLRISWISVDLSALAAAVLVNPAEKDTSNSLSRSQLKGLFSSNHSRASLTASASRFICEVDHLSRLLSKYVNWHLRSGSGSAPSTCGLKHNISSSLCLTLLLTWLPSSVFALYRCQTRRQTNHDRSNGQHGFHSCWNFRRSPCNQIKMEVVSSALLTVQPCALGILMMLSSWEDV